MYVMKLFDKKSGITKTLEQRGGEYHWSVATNSAVTFTDAMQARDFQKKNMLPYDPKHYDLYLSKVKVSGRGSYGHTRMNRKNPLSVPHRHQMKVALDTLKMTPAMIGIMGGMNLKEAYLFMREKAGWSDKRIQDYMREHGYSHTEIQDLMKSIHLSSMNPGRSRRNPGEDYTPGIFKNLSIGDTFDFVSPDLVNSFYDRCEKTSARTYRSLDSGESYRVGSIRAKVYHVKKKNPGRSRRNPDDDDQWQDFDLHSEMSEGYVIHDIPRGGYDVNLSSKYLWHIREFDDVLRAIIKHSKASNFWPNVFYVNDHGNVDLIAIDIKSNKVSYRTIKSWV